MLYLCGVLGLALILSSAGFGATSVIDVRVETDFPNASPLEWHLDDGGVLRVQVQPDHQRDSDNVAGNHWHFAVSGPAGVEVRLVLEGLHNVYNGRKVDIALDRLNAWVSDDREVWRALPLQRSGAGRSEAVLPLRGGKVWVARLEPADAQLAPENAALERWVAERQAAGARFVFFIDLHNDHFGKIHAGLPAGDPAAYAHLVRRYEALLREHTWFTEGVVNKAAGNPGTSADGMAARFGIPGVVQELNADWLAGREGAADAQAWREFGAALPAVLAELLERERR